MQDAHFNLITARFPGDVELLSQEVIKLVKSISEERGPVVP